MARLVWMIQVSRTNHMVSWKQKTFPDYKESRRRQPGLELHPLVLGLKKKEEAWAKECTWSPKNQKNNRKQIIPWSLQKGMQPCSLQTLWFWPLQNSQNSHLQNYMIIKLYLLSCKLLVICYFSSNNKTTTIVKAFQNLL